MRMSELDYTLPAEAIAVRPAAPRDAGRVEIARKTDLLLVEDRLDSVRRLGRRHGPVGCFR